MDSHLRPEDESMRISIADSPRRSPLITHAVTSPPRSLHPEHHDNTSGHMMSISTAVDLSHGPADFFDDDSDDEVPTAAEVGIAMSDPGARPSSPSKREHPPPTIQTLAAQCLPKRSTFPLGTDGYQRLDTRPHLAEEVGLRETPSNTSYAASMDELLPSDQVDPPQVPEPAHAASDRTLRSSGNFGSQEERPYPQYSEKVEQLIGAHAIAHEITLQALLRDEDAIDRGLHSFAPVTQSLRTPLLPYPLRAHDPRSPRDRRLASVMGQNKRVQVIPPPIDTSAPQRSLPDDLVRTPYPSDFDPARHKDFARPIDSASERSPSVSENILTLSIRRSNPNSLSRFTTLVLPASNDYSIAGATVRSEKQRTIKTSNFDDEEFFRQLQKSYAGLTGIARLMSARSLTRIVVSGPASRAADAGYGWLQQPKSPRRLAQKGSTDTFSEEAIMQHYRNPNLGRARYAFVHWAHRIAGAPPVQTPTGEGEEVREQVSRDFVRQMERPEGLEFVVSWSVKRIASALTSVILLSIAAALLWTLLGKNTVTNRSPHGGFRDAGDRVGAGVLLGICILLVGLSGIAGWLGISWLVM